MKILFIIIGLLCYTTAYSKTFDLPYGGTFDIRGYVGWQQIISAVDYDSVHSDPEIGITTSARLSKEWEIFNQFRFGTDIDTILVYNQINYTPDIPIDNFSLTLKGGKLWYDWGLYGKTRVNPRTRLGIIQPQAIYWNTLDQTITGGYGVGFSIKYKTFNMSYTASEPGVSNRDEMAGAWITPQSENYRSDAFSSHMVTMDYEIPDYGLRFHANWNLFQFKYDQPGFRNNIYANPQNIGGGVEWQYNKFTTSLEGMCTKPPGVSWGDFTNVLCGISPTMSYEITENISIQGNYNQYRTPNYSRISSENFTRDINLNLNWHSGPWMASVEGHYIRGGRLVDPSNLNAHPDAYKNFYVVGLNVVYFWE